MLVPALSIAAMVPGGIGFWGFMLAFIFAWSVKAALIEPIAIYSLMQVYFKTIEGQQPGAEWSAKLEKASKHFRELKEKAVAMATGREGTSTTT